MASGKRALQVAIVGSAKGPGGFSGALKDAEKDVGRFEGRMGRASKQIAKGFAVAGAAVGAGMVTGLKKSADAAIEAEKSQVRLAAQMKASGIDAQRYSAEIDKVITAQSRLTGFDDEDLQDTFTGLLRATGDVNKSYQGLAVASDLARARQMDVGKAGDVVAKVLNGNTGILKRYGVSIDENATATEALSALSGKFAGQAEAYGKTTAGALDRSKVAAENLGEMVGARLTPFVAKAGLALAGFLEEMQSGEGVGGRFAQVLKGIGTGISAVARVVSAAGRRIGQFIGDVRDAFNGGNRDAVRFKNRVGNALGDVVGFFRNLGRNIGRTFDGVEGDLRTIGRQVGRFALVFMGAWREVLTVVGRRVIPALKAVIEGLANVVRGVVRVVAGVLSGDFSKAWKGTKQIVSGALKALVGVIRGLWGLLGDAMTALAKALIRALGAGLKGLAGAIKRAVVSGVKSGLTAAKDALGGVVDTINPFSSITGNVNGKGDVSDSFRAWAKNRGGALLAPPAPGGGFGGTQGLQTEAKQGLSFLQRKFGGLRVSSGFRTEEENRRVGGAPDSDHLTGLGLDLVPAEGWGPAGTARLDRIAAWARSSPAIRWIGWRGVPDHGPGNHLHLSFADRVAGDVTARTAGATKGGAQSETEIIAAAARAAGIDPAILWGLYGAESDFGRNTNNSSAGAQGPFQFMPATAKAYGINPHNFRQAAFAAAKYLATYKDRGVAGMLAAYNAGPGNSPPWPAETNAYIPKVQRLARTWPGAGGGGVSGGGSSSSPAPSRPKISVGTAKGMTGGLGSAGGPVAGSPADLEQEIAAADLGIALANGDPGKLDRAIRRKLDATKRRMAKIQAALKADRQYRKSHGRRGKLLRAATKIRLQLELAQLVTDARDLGENLSDLAENGVDPETGEIRSEAPGAADAGEAPSPLDFLNSEIARSTVNDDPNNPETLRDNLGPMERLRDFLFGEMREALADADPRNDAEAISAWQGARDAVIQLNETINNGSAAQQAHTDALKQLADAMTAQTNFATSAMATQSGQAWKALADIMSSQLGPRVAARGLMPSYGYESRR